MNEPDFQHELADELLSAYLDDELSPAERAAVESRLASDPAAQQMLHQLRSVSQSIQRLPLESVGTDVRGKILERIEGLRISPQPQAAADVQPSSAGDILPKITAFNSRRSWIWASLAVAAGLMIMFLERGAVRNKQLPAIAKNDADASAARRLTTRREAIGSSGGVAVDSSTVVSAEKPAPALAAPPAASPPPPAAPVASATPSLQPTQLGTRVKSGDELAMSGKVSSPPAAPAREGVPTAGLAIGGRGGAQPELRGGTAIATNSAGAASMPAAAASTEAKVAREKLAPSVSEAREDGAPTDSFVVVHVLAKPAAMQNRAFDKLLLSNGIDIEAESRGEEERVGDNVQQPSEADKTAPEFGALKMPQQADEVDMVLVDAPESAVKSCLAGLQKDADNYAGVEVEETADTDRSKQRAQLEKKLAFDLGQYNRGMVPQKQKDNFRNQFYYRRTEVRDEAELETAATREPVAVASPTQNLSELERVQRRARSPDNRGRAVRFSLSNTENLQRAADNLQQASVGERRSANAPAATPARDGEKLSEGPAAENNLQVLFMLSPAEEAAASTPAEKQPE